MSDKEVHKMGPKLILVNIRCDCDQCTEAQTSACGVDVIVAMESTESSKWPEMTKWTSDLQEG